MEAKERDVEYFETSGGNQPVRNWIDSLKDRRGRAKIQTRIDRVALGNFGNCEPVGSGVLELKVDFGPGYRIYFGLDGEQLVILLCGGDKSSQKSDIKLAKEYWNQYRSGYGKKK